MKIGKKGTFVLASIIAAGSVLALSADADAHARKKSKGSAQTARSNRATGGAEDNRMSDGDFFLSCKGFVPDFGGETSCGPAVDLGDE